ncbi:anaerobic ribonucleoside-triphosphate reductase [Rhodanobacter sp. 115]|uniref:anaerobic ribonucleoside-triphosphate reductase n=1 Tax=Rhodanobacter sp. FW021-MT20 TaxID=1162282 RepID=UPI000260DB9A|nr:anaerobic ribonucleoside-triphosphate reductase [Rhodanobacter sp. 115]EIL86853.1 hypothetical protein UU5_20630 [Rhodanobacter sp. 115]
MGTTASSTEAPTPVLADSERQRCEVWTRVMGYHRPVSSFNIGKQGEHMERRFFEERAAGLDRAA